MWVSVAEAAASLGVSDDTIRRRTRRKLLSSRVTEDGRLEVEIPDAVQPSAPAEHDAASAQQIAALTAEVAGLRALVAEKDARIEAMTAEVDAARRQAEAAAVDRHELLLLTQRQQITIESLLPKLAPPEDTGATNVAGGENAPPGQRKTWWRWW